MDSPSNTSSISPSTSLPRSKSSGSSPGPGFSVDARMPVSQTHFAQEAENRDLSKQSAACSKVPKRKRLAKACDACHKSKRRCDGTAPCSNCYFASKECTYTDASGRPVPAPRAGHPSEDSQHRGQQGSVDGASTHVGPAVIPAARTAPQVHHVKLPSPLGSGDPHDLNDAGDIRKRRRVEQAPKYNGPVIPSPPQAVLMKPPILDRSNSPDAALTRELVNLFFTHCHPSRLILHKPSFSAALSHNGVPPYLLHAIYALAAPLSKQPGIRTTPLRLAGKRFFNEAIAMMFDSTGRLCCPPDLVTAQALCLLQMHVIQTSHPTTAPIKYHDLALGIIENAGVYKPDNPVITPLPSAEHIRGSIERECMRRVFWFIYWIELLRQTYAHRSMLLRREGHDENVRLPVDETSFELAVHITLPAEYLHFPPPRMRYASEFGHLIRVTKIMTEFETKVCPSCSGGMLQNDRARATQLQHTEKQLDEWAQSLAEHLRFNEQNLQLQISMFETSSNTGAWCFFFMHAMYASCVLAINELKRTAKGEAPNSSLDWARSTLNQILSSLGNRAKNSFILAAILWPLYKYCKEDNQQLREWSAAYQEFWGVEIKDLALNSQSPHPPELYASGSSSSTSRTSDYSLPIAKPANLEINDPYAPDARSERADGPLLPSLKASGLLDSWRPVGDSNGPNGNPWTSSNPPLAGRELALNTMDPSRHPHPAAGVPVGMPWLANEP
ncbi:hypothetical protein NEOLEDRAFT_64616 [Neolentinus lepideus HHB14362 ss-1]|uniref:Zn(2)-C6 fungal-type domain-containing protein n=1 Tax=Neolentinus lepideus HHB14362 ss-1 TaxID=1314782 RepID=A0A165U9Z1_9AGAM|nr:hypothetical protein NEOLEDRAFT_64616 [Neolentinus lepideus HHB14362 ss-1]